MKDGSGGKELVSEKFLCTERYKRKNILYRRLKSFAMLCYNVSTSRKP